MQAVLATTSQQKGEILAKLAKQPKQAGVRFVEWISIQCTYSCLFVCDYPLGVPSFWNEWKLVNGKGKDKIQRQRWCAKSPTPPPRGAHWKRYAAKGATVKQVFWSTTDGTFPFFFSTVFYLCFVSDPFFKVPDPVFKFRLGGATVHTL
jgi:hypothetical protein